jgi:hypothetical protein
MDSLNMPRPASAFFAVLGAVFCVCVGSLPSLAQETSPASKMIRLVGTCVTQDETTPVADVKVTLLPPGTETRSDAEGDFVFDWDGNESYLEFHLDDSAFCAQLVVRAFAPMAESGTIAGEPEGVTLIDVGPIVSVPTRQRSGPATAGMRPGVAPPDEIPESGPDPNLRRLWFALRADLDRFGRIVTIDHHTGDTPSPDLLLTLDTWMRTLEWRTPDLAPCHSPAFRTIIPMAYDWDAQSRTWKRDPNNRPR